MFRSSRCMLFHLILIYVLVVLRYETDCKSTAVDSKTNEIINPRLVKRSLVPSTPANVSYNSTLPCYQKDAWKLSEYDDGKKCLTSACAEDMLDMFDLYMTCNKRVSPTDVQAIGGYLNKYFILRAEEMITPKSYNPVKRTYVRKQRTYFQIEYGFIRVRFLKRSDHLLFPHRETESYRMPPTLLETKISAYLYTDFNLNIYEANVPVDYLEEDTPLTHSIFVLDGRVKTASVANVLNSRIISVLARPTLSTHSEFVDIFLAYRDYKGTINHKCVHSAGHLGQSPWTNKGCHAALIKKRSIHCRCENPMGNYAVISELYVEPLPPEVFKQEGLTFVLVIICIIGIFVCFMCLALPHCVGCSHIGGMIRIYRYSDFTQALEYVVFIIGVYSNRHETASSLIAASLHFLHCAVMFWAIVEGIYLYHKIKPLYHYSTGMIFFFSTVTFGITATFTGASSGYQFQFGENVQYIWMKTNNNDILYFLVPIAILVLLTIAVDWVLIMEMKYWIGFHDDYVYGRAPYFIYRQSGFVGVCIISFFLGNMSMATGGVGSYSFLFAGFFAIQFLCRFYSHFVWNYEVWDWKTYNEAHIAAVRKEQEARLLQDINNKQKKERGAAVAVDIHSSDADSDFESSEEEDETAGIDGGGTMKSLQDVDKISNTGIINPVYDDEPETTCEEEPLTMQDEEHNDEEEQNNDDEDDKKESEEEEEPNADDEHPLTEPKKVKKKKLTRKPSIVPRMTKAALARMKKNEEEQQ